MYVRLLATAAIAALAPLSALAAPVTISINLTVTSSDFGNFLGDTGTASITYDDDQLVLGTANYVSDPIGSGIPFFAGFDFSINMFGQTFTDSADPDSFFLVLNDTPADWSLSISESDAFSPTPINDPLLLGFGIISTGSNLTEVSPGVFAADVIVSDVNVVPLPASALMLGAALGGIGVAARRRRKA